VTSQLPHRPANKVIEPAPAATAELSSAPTWLDYPIKVSPHHTDHGGVVWHGSYLTWMEEARIEALREIGVEYADLVAIGCELPVVDLSIRYQKALRMGQTAIVRCRLQPIQGVRLIWDYEIRSGNYQDLYITAQVTLVAIDLEKGKIMRRLPPLLKDALTERSI
jgi:acyl-CoA thioester hydrolase